MNQHRQRYDQAQQEIVRASLDLEVFRMLDLGVGMGETTRDVWRRTRRRALCASIKAVTSWRRRQVF